ncbi:hypothetical protein TRIP_B200091 [uncultured Desulfatiglans sp.]|nr:hypothetical protein TRIP_B200091 [uncultured Desulfatiglans sp.]
MLQEAAERGRRLSEAAKSGMVVPAKTFAPDHHIDAGI